MYYVQHYADGRWQSFGVDNSPWEFLTFEDAKAELFEAKCDDHSLKLRILEINEGGWGWSTKFVANGYEEGRVKLEGSASCEEPEAPHTATI